MILNKEVLDISAVKVLMNDFYNCSLELLNYNQIKYVYYIKGIKVKRDDMLEYLTNNLPKKK